MIFSNSYITQLKINSFFNVYNNLGHGFLDKVYENSKLIEFEKLRLKAKNQVPVRIKHDEIEVGNYIADIVIEDKVIVELNTAESIYEEHEAQLTNYPHSTNINLDILQNFGRNAQFERKIFHNYYKLNQHH
jgi:hypothetical protein